MWEMVEAFWKNPFSWVVILLVSGFPVASDDHCDFCTDQFGRAPSEPGILEVAGLPPGGRN